MKNVYHYTSAGGAVGIIGETGLGSMWMTNISYMNDHSEFNIGFDKIEDYLNDLTKNSLVRQFFGSDFFGNVKKSIFVASFSEKRDDLSQWRGYCSRGGYCLGISFDALQSMDKKSDFIFKKCQYADHELIIKKLKDKLTKAFIDADRNVKSESERNSNHMHFVIMASQWIAETIPFIKNPVFKDEDEWRLIKVRNFSDQKEVQNFKYRVSSDFLVPYYNFTMSDFYSTSIVNEVIVGPGPHRERALAAMQQMLMDISGNHNTGLSVKVEGTNMTLVSW